MNGFTKEQLTEAKRKFQFQRWNSRRRKDRLGNPIEWKLTFEQWLDFWLQSGHWHQRGCGKNSYVMARFGDLGAYELGNIEIKLAGENTTESNLLQPRMHNLGKLLSKEVKEKISNKLKGHTKTQSHKDKLSKAFSKPVMTPYGKFESVRQAEKILKKDFGWQKKKDPDNWYYIK